ncbi:DUF6795 domain-containing protein [Oceanobacter mangrovi]|uniref:DUF6795 domain-containing protein n=1 Tax=Oceanobacter mangrovi TaxID=2862510 RepID=UPI001C8D6C9B|nr:DUF6795 domain-containing protein [Oceanobacter mangrovi]
MIKETICAFSGFDGQLFKNGVPLANEKVIRQYEWSDKIHREETTTDENGYFSFESAWEDYEYIIEFHFSIPQRIFYTHDENVIWGGVKQCAYEFSEFGEKRPFLTCDVSDELKGWPVENNLIMTSFKEQEVPHV